MRAIWTGSIAFGLVNVPVKLYAATADHDVAFHQVHDRDRGRIHYRRVCEVCGADVEHADIARAYRADDDRTVLITDDDLAALPAERSREIEVLEFVPAAEIDPMLYERSYFLEPAATSPKAYALLARTLADTDRVAVTHFALRGKTRLAALRVRDFGTRTVLVLQTLLWPDEVREPDFPALDEPAQLSATELKLAGQVVDSMAAEFDPDRFHDTYQQQLRELIEQRLAGAAPGAAEAAPADLDATEDVSDLLAKLQASIRSRAR